MFVVLSHIPMNQSGVGLPSWHWGAMFYRGATAVDFFFTLSGFLITYLLLDEQQRHGRISVRAFYVRRILRIWPLYFLIIGFGLFFYWVLVPASGMVRPIEYRLSTAVALYGLFLSNLMSSLYNVGGILNPTWSIGVEEQYYLTWAPVVAWLKGRILPVLGCLFLFFLALSFGVHYRQEELGSYAKFLGSLKFHFMAAGGLLAYTAFHHRDRLLAVPFLRRSWLRWAMLGLVVEFYFVGFSAPTWEAQELVQLLIYPWLLAEVALQERPILRLARPWTERLGEASYGVYMVHMVVIHAVSFLFLRTSWWKGSPVLYLLTYYTLAIGGTIAAALLSYRYFERPFLRLKERFAA